MHIKPRHLPSSQINLLFHSTDCLHARVLNNTNFVETCSTTIEKVETYKYLGVYVDSSFKWKVHIENLQKKLRTTSYMLYHLSHCATYSVLRQAYFSLTESYIRHGITAWGSVKYSTTLQKAQNQILKILLKKLQTTCRTNNIIDSTITQQNHYAATHRFNNIESNINNSNLNNNSINNNNIHISINNNRYPNNNNSRSNSGNNNNVYNTTHNNIYSNNNSRTVNCIYSNNIDVNHNNNNNFNHNANNNNHINDNNVIINVNNVTINNNNNNIAHNNSRNVNFGNNNNIVNNNHTTNHNSNGNHTNSLAKTLHVLNVKNIYYSTIAKEFFQDNRFLQPIDHSYNTRRRAQGKFKISSFSNEFGRSTLSVTLPKTFNLLPTNIINTSDEKKRTHLIKKHFISLQ